MKLVFAAILIAGALIGGGAWLGQRQEEPQGAVLAATASSLPDVAAERVQIGATSLFDLSQGAALSVRASGPGTLRATVTPSGGDAVPVGETHVGANQAVRFRVPAQTARALASCRTVRLTIAVTASGGKVTARRSRTLAPQPPACGRFFGPKAAWNERAERAKLDPLSSTLVKALNEQVEGNFAANFPPTINTANYSAPVYTVPAGQKRVPVYLVGERLQWGAALAAQLAEGVPIPPKVRAAWGSDHHMVIWQPATDTMWELWVADDAKGRWEAQWGGRIDHVSQSPGPSTTPAASSRERRRRACPWPEA